MAASLIEEADAIDWYQQRMSVEHNEEAGKIMQDSQEEIRLLISFPKLKEARG